MSTPGDGNRTRRAIGHARRLIAELAGDFRHAIRVHAGTPGVTLLALATTALAIGANTAIFSMTDALLLRPLPLPRPERLVSLFHVETERRSSYSSFSFPDYEELRDGVNGLASLAAQASIEMDLGTGENTQAITAGIVSGNWFDVVGAAPVIGRTFAPEEDRTPGSAAVAVISRSMWDRRFASDPSIVGRELILNGHTFTVIGVAPDAVRSLDLRSSAELWVPLMMHAVAMPSFHAFGVELFGNRGTHWLDLVGRLDDGRTLESARAALQSIASRQAAAYPETNRDWSIEAVPAGEARFGSPDNGTAVQATTVLAAVVGIVLLIACANIANLLLARSVVRRREMAIRVAVGARRGRLLRQLLVESVTLALAGGILGVGLAFLSLDLADSVRAMTGLTGLDARIDARVLGFALGLSVFTGIAFGIVPALQASSTSVAPVMKENAPGAGQGRSQLGSRWLLVAVQVALCVVLLVGAGLAVRTLLNLRSLPLGFEIDDLTFATFELPEDRYVSDAAGLLFYDRLVDRVQAMNGTAAAGLAFISPFSGWRMANDIFWENPGSPEARDRTNVDMNVVGPDYFVTLGIPVVRGRSFAARDDARAAHVAIVNEALARRLWPGEDPIGKRLWSWAASGEDEELEVIGLVRDGRYYRSWRSADRPFLFVSLAQHYQNRMTLHVRGGARAVTADELRTLTASLDPQLRPPVIVRAKEAMLDDIAFERTGATLLALFAALALAIAAIGVYGVVAFMVTSRTHELGLRMALGAELGDVTREIMKAGILPTLAGAAAGLVVALGTSRLMSGLLFGVSPIDPVTFVIAAGSLTAVALLATWLPARRAMRLDPMVALRSQI